MREASSRKASSASTPGPQHEPLLGLPSGEEVEHLRPCLHCVDDQFVAAIEGQHDRLEQPTLSVEAESELPSRRVVVEIYNPDRS